VSKPEPENLPAILGEDMSLDPNSILLGRILAAGLKFHEWIWHHDKEEVEAELKNRPELNRYKMASFAMFFNRAVPSKSFLFHGRVGNKKAITPEQLEKAGLSEEQLRKIAGIED